MVGSSIDAPFVRPYCWLPRHDGLPASTNWVGHGAFAQQIRCIMWLLRRTRKGLLLSLFAAGQLPRSHSIAASGDLMLSAMREPHEFSVKQLDRVLQESQTVKK